MERSPRHHPADPTQSCIFSRTTQRSTFGNQTLMTPHASSSHTRTIANRITDPGARLHHPRATPAAQLLRFLLFFLVVLVLIVVLSTRGQVCQSLDRFRRNHLREPRHNNRRHRIDIQFNMWLLKLRNQACRIPHPQQYILPESAPSNKQCKMNDKSCDLPELCLHTTTTPLKKHPSVNDNLPTKCFSNTFCQCKNCFRFICRFLRSLQKKSCQRNNIPPTQPAHGNQTFVWENNFE